jgi:hypothetical protein
VQDDILGHQSSVNPVTARLAAGVDDVRLLEFIQRWDELERLVVDICRSGRANRNQRAAYRTLRKALFSEYPSWEADFAPYRVELQLEGNLEDGDPFGRLLGIQRTADLIGSNSAIEALPDARQVLNHFLLDRAPEESGAGDG